MQMFEHTRDRLNAVIKLFFLAVVLPLTACNIYYGEQYGPKIQEYREQEMPIVRVFFCDSIGQPVNAYAMTKEEVWITLTWTGLDADEEDENELDRVALYFWQKGQPKLNVDLYDCSFLGAEGYHLIREGNFMEPLYHQGNIVVEAIAWDRQQNPGPPYPEHAHVRDMKAACACTAMLIDDGDSLKGKTKKEKLASADTWGKYTSGLPGFHIMPLWEPDPNLGLPDQPGLEELRGEYKRMFKVMSGFGAYKDIPDSTFWCTYSAARGDGRLYNSGSYMWAKPIPVVLGYNNPLSSEDYTQRLQRAKRNNPNCWQAYEYDAGSGFQQGGFMYYYSTFRSNPDTSKRKVFLDAQNLHALGSNCFNFVWCLLNDAGYNSSQLNSYPSGQSLFKSNLPILTGEDIVAKAAPGDIVEYYIPQNSYNHTALLIHKEGKDPLNWGVVSCNGFWSIWTMGTVLHTINDYRSENVGGRMIISDDSNWGSDWPVTDEFNVWGINDIRVYTVPEN